MSKEIEYGKAATSLSLMILSAGAQKMASGEKFTEIELKLIGRSLGWFTLVSAGTEYDALNSLNTLSEKVNIEASSTTPITKERTAITAGRSKKRGGEISGMAKLMGILALTFAGNTIYDNYNAYQHRSLVLSEANAQIHAACSSDILAGIPPNVPWLDSWLGNKKRQELANFNAAKASCAAIKISMDAKIAVADEQIRRATEVIPDAVGAVFGAASLVSLGPVGTTPQGLATASATGAFARDLASRVIQGPKSLSTEEVGKIVNGISKGFPTPTPSPPPPPPPPYVDTTKLPGGRRTRRSRKMRFRRRTMRR